MTEKVGEGGPRRNASSARQSRGQKVWFVIQSNVLRYPLIRIHIMKVQDKGKL